MDSCTIIIPCYNEADRLDVGAFRRFAAHGHPVRFLFVDDGSTDGTPAILEGLRGADPSQFDVCRLPNNRGKAEAVRQGVLRALAADPEVVGFWDADLATPLDAIPEFLEVLRSDPRRQIVIGSRVKLLGRSIERRWLRHCLGRVFAVAASAVLRLPVYDTQCGAKLFRVGPDIRRLFADPFRTGWVFDVELLARLLVLRRQGVDAAAGETTAVGETVYELPVRCWRDVAGSKVRPWDFFRAAGELTRIYWVYLRRRAAIPVSLQAEPRGVVAATEPVPSRDCRNAA